MSGYARSAWYKYHNLRERELAIYHDAIDMHWRNNASKDQLMKCLTNKWQSKGPNSECYTFDFINQCVYLSILNNPRRIDYNDERCLDLFLKILCSIERIRKSRPLARSFVWNEVMAPYFTYLYKWLARDRRLYGAYASSNVWGLDVGYDDAWTTLSLFAKHNVDVAWMFDNLLPALSYSVKRPPLRTGDMKSRVLVVMGEIFECHSRCLPTANIVRGHVDSREDLILIAHAIACEFSGPYRSVSNIGIAGSNEIYADIGSMNDLPESIGRMCEYYVSAVEDFVLATVSRNVYRLSAALERLTVCAGSLKLFSESF